MDLSIASAAAYNTGISALGRRAAQPAAEQPASSPASAGEEQQTAIESASRRPTPATQESSGLTPEEQQQLRELQQRDREVKAHELAHKAAGGRYVTGGSFTYQTGPDGARYAIGGEVTIDSSSGGTPRETLSKAELIRRAALAPADPSPQDYRVASQANLMAAQARSEISAEQREEAMQAREARQAQQQDADATDNPRLTRQNQRAIAAFEAIGGSGTLRTDPDPVDELI